MEGSRCGVLADDTPASRHRVVAFLAAAADRAVSIVHSTHPERLNSPSACAASIDRLSREAPSAIVLLADVEAARCALHATSGRLIPNATIWVGDGRLAAVVDQPDAALHDMLQGALIVRRAAVPAARCKFCADVEGRSAVEAVHALAHAIQLGGASEQPTGSFPPSGVAIRAMLEAVRFDGPCGAVHFDSSQHLRPVSYDVLNIQQDANLVHVASSVDGTLVATDEGVMWYLPGGRMVVDLQGVGDNTTSAASAAAVGSRAGCACIESHDIERVTRFGQEYIIYTDGDKTDHLYPPSYGLGSCRAWDVNLSPSCATQRGQPIPDAKPWCSSTWCYIDRFYVPPTCVYTCI